MTSLSEELRSAVAARAQGRCEYCHFPAHGQAHPFPIDHIVPKSRGGLAELSNLALACPRCNGSKWAHVDSIDSATNERVPLFNPRTELWEVHFQWSSQSPFQIEGKTAIGRATVTRLQMNAPAMIEARLLLAGAGLFPEIPD